MVTGSKKPKTAPKAKAAPRPKATVKAKAAASKPKTTAKPKITKASAKTDSKTKVAGKATGVRKVGEMVYNDELFEALSEAVLLGKAVGVPMPEVKKRLHDYDIYMVSFLTDEEIDKIAKDLLKANGAGKSLKPGLMAVRDNARVFIDIATKHNSVRGFIDRVLGSKGRAAGMDTLKSSFGEGKFRLSEVSPETCESFLLIF